MNIGIHLFDLLLWLFGPVTQCEVHWKEPTRMAGALALRNADVQWLLSIEPDDLSAMPEHRGPTWRSVEVDGEGVEFTEGFADLHTVAYRSILEGGGPRIADARPSIELVHAVRNAGVARRPGREHPLLERLLRGTA
jgi:UDP-N-acetyl-2-amino-2-deoxyglucuronate dehydrogenase